MTHVKKQQPCAPVVYIWQYPIRGSVFHLNFPKIVVNGIALHFWLFRLSITVDSIMEAGVLKYPDLFNIVFFKVHADLVKMGKISEISPF